VTTIDEYIADFPRPVQTLLKRVRSSIRSALPGADESISYRIPTYKLNGRPILYFAAFKEHYSVYPANARLVAAFEQELAPYEFNAKGTIRFPFDKPVPAALIKRIAAFRANEVAAIEKAKSVNTARSARKATSARQAKPAKTKVKAAKRR
jgi:uncharacterized protein YdhG (YjbR/CyaY superfamily)